MAKDAKGHGSEARGGGSFDRINAQRVAEGYKPMPEKNRGLHEFLDYMGGEGEKPSFMNAGGGQPVASNASAAATLASGPKSAPVPTHNGADGPTNPRYNRVAVQNAINSSRQKIGGREAKMIHRLLSGGH